MKTNTLPQNPLLLRTDNTDAMHQPKTTEPAIIFHDTYDYFPDFGI